MKVKAMIMAVVIIATILIIGRIVSESAEKINQLSNAIQQSSRPTR